MLDCLSAIVRKQGPLGLFQGFSAQWLRFGPYAVVQFVVWEALRDMFGDATVGCRRSHDSAALRWPLGRVCMRHTLSRLTAARATVFY